MYNKRCPKCGEQMQMTPPTNDWGVHLLCRNCGYSEPLEKEEKVIYKRCVSKKCPNYHPQYFQLFNHRKRHCPYCKSKLRKIRIKELPK